MKFIFTIVVWTIMAAVYAAPPNPDAKTSSPTSQKPTSSVKTTSYYKTTSTVKTTSSHQTSTAKTVSTRKATSSSVIQSKKSTSTVNPTTPTRNPSSSSHKASTKLTQTTDSSTSTSTSTSTTPSYAPRPTCGTKSPGTNLIGNPEFADGYTEPYWDFSALGDNGVIYANDHEGIATGDNVPNPSLNYNVAWASIAVVDKANTTDVFTLSQHDLCLFAGIKYDLSFYDGYIFYRYSEYHIPTETKCTVQASIDEVPLIGPVGVCSNPPGTSNGNGTCTFPGANAYIDEAYESRHATYTPVVDTTKATLKFQIDCDWTCSGGCFPDGTCNEGCPGESWAVLIDSVSLAAAR